MSEFEPFPKIPRLSRDCIITEKLDGTNAQIMFDDDMNLWVGSRSRWLSPAKGQDNFGFCQWVYDHEKELRQLGPGRHYGEWWGKGIQRGYGLEERRFSLFHTAGIATLPACVSVVPVLFKGVFDSHPIDNILDELVMGGSRAAPGFMKPEGIVIYHIVSRTMFKKTIEGDEKPKGQDAP